MMFNTCFLFVKKKDFIETIHEAYKKKVLSGDENMNAI